MKKLYILLLICLTASYNSEAQTLGVDTFTLGEDNSDNYGGTWGTTNQGTGFSDWVFDTATPGGGFAGRFIGSFSSALDVNGNSFGMFANSGNGAVSGATVTMPKTMEEGDSFTVSIGVNFRDGNKGFDLRDSSNTTIINLNVGSDQYNITGTSGLFSNSYDSNTVFTCTFTQNAGDVSWTVVRSGGQSGSQSGTIGSISPGTIDNIRFYNVSAGTNGDGGGARNLFVNSLNFESLYTIDENSTVNVTSNTTVPYLTVNSGSTLNVSGGNAVSVTGNFSNSGTVNLNSTSTTYSSLIVDGAATGDVTYNRFVNSNANGNDLVAPPVSGQSWSDFLSDNSTALLDDGGTTYAFGPFDKTTGTYVNYNSGTVANLESGTGYRAATDSGETLAFTGTPETSSFLAPIENSGPINQKWNLVGNPYASYMDAASFLTANISQFDPTTAGIWGYDGTATNGWTIVNLATVAANPLVAPGQGFFVSASGSTTIQFDESWRTSGASDDYIAGRQGGLVYMTLNINNSLGGSFNTDVYFNQFASLGFDLGFDAELFTVPGDFALYTLLVQEDEGDPYALQAVSDDDLANVVIPLGVNAPQGEQLTFTLAVNELPPTTEVYLDDTVENASTLLNTGDYIVTPTVQLFGSGRFFLRIEDDTLSDADDQLENPISILALAGSKEITINGQLQGNTVANLYDIQGRLVLSKSLDSSLIQNRLDTSSLSPGIYVINVSNNAQQKTQKLIIK